MSKPKKTAAAPKPSADERQALRQRAEAQLANQPGHQATGVAALSPQATQHLLHELQVHQIELEMQNDALRQSSEELERARARYFDLYDLAPVGYLTLSAQGVILEANLTAAILLGVTRNALTGRALHSFVTPQDQDNFYLLCTQLNESGMPQSRELKLVCHGGRLLWVHLMATAAVDYNNTPVLRMVLSDINTLKSFERQLDHLAHYDALTNLPNRLLKADRLQQAMVQARRSANPLAVVYIDLDGFKTINDSYGHDVGDQLLVAVANQMQQVLREGDTLARLGGDEFVAVLINLGSVAACVPLLERLLAAAAQPLRVKGKLLQVSASLGVTFYPQAQEIEGDQLLRQADQAMYQAKQTGKNKYQIFDAAQDHTLRELHQEQQRLSQALQAHELVLHYQPKVNLRNGQVMGVEALIRWQHPDRGLLSPDEFLPAIEEHPLIIAIGEWVMEEVLLQIKAWQAQGLDMAVSVNVSAQQLQQPDFVARLRELLARHCTVSPSHLMLEILETSALQDVAYVSQVIEDCRQFGVLFALDDFGTGYSSLTYLRRLRVTLLKIDQSFVHDMLDNPGDLSILKGVIGLAQAFGCDVIAEGVETQAHGTRLLQLGCDLAQGSAIARPMAAQELPKWVATWKTNPVWGPFLMDE